MHTYMKEGVFVLSVNLLLLFCHVCIGIWYKIIFGFFFFVGMMRGQNYKGKMARNSRQQSSLLFLRGERERKRKRDL